MPLWRLILQVLRVTFEFDQDGMHPLRGEARFLLTLCTDFYQAPSHFGPVSTALVAQLARPNQNDVQSLVIPAIVGLVAATELSDQHKQLNAGILQHVRSDNAKVRLSAVQCQRALTDRLGDDWLALLPEMLPFISELQEDDDEIVERETLRWIQKIEETIGESLNPMLQ